MIIAVMIELIISICAMWFLTFLSTFLHELGHALGYMFATGDRHWHIRVGWGKRLLHTKALTVNLLVFDGVFTPSEKKIDTRAKLIRSDILADGVIESFLNYAFFLNLGLFV